MKKVYTILTLAVAASALASCDLDLTPKGSISYNPSQIIVNESDMSGFEAGIIATFRGLDYGVYDWASDVQMDEFNATYDYGNNGGDVHRSTFTANDYDTRDNYSGPFSAIRTFNIAIDGMLNVPSEFTARAAVARGEAYLGRAFAYIHLARLFGKPYGSTSSTDLCVPLVTKYDQLARPARATVQQIYDQVKTDLDSAAVLLAGIPGSARAERPTIDAVNALYARYYLDVKDYTKAAASAAAVIKTGHYKLATTKSLLIEECINDNGTEPILQFFASLSEGGAGGHGYYTGASYDGEHGHGLYFHPYFLPTKTLVESYDAHDIRLAAWYNDTTAIYMNGSYYVGTGLKTFTKYVGNPKLRSSDVPNSANCIKPLMISEMYLIAAEAYAQAGNAAEAKTYLNDLQKARGATISDGSMANVKKEWFRETPGEGLRISCLKRWGDGFSGRPEQTGAADLVISNSAGQYADKALKPDDFHWQWPMPTYEMQTNLNLVQNPGYAEN